jgi:hypothetical protein
MTTLSPSGQCDTPGHHHLSSLFIHWAGGVVLPGHCCCWGMQWWLGPAERWMWQLLVAVVMQRRWVVDVEGGG